MDWDHLRIFLEVARAAQFQAAALKLGVDNATVSRRISTLEKDLGTRLFNRGYNGCALTRAGDRLYAAAEEIEAEILHAEGDLSQADLEVSGCVRIGAPDVLAAIFISPLLGKLKTAYPSLTVQVVPMSRTLSLSKREADLAITIQRPAEGRLAVRKLVDYSLHCYAAKSYLSEYGAPESVSDMKRHRIVTYVQELIFAEVLNFIPELFGPDYSRIECSSAVCQLEAVRAGAGIGILHDYAVHSDPNLQTVLPEIRFDRTYWLIAHSNMRGLGRVRAVSDFLMREAGARRSNFKAQNVVSTDVSSKMRSPDRGRGLRL